MNKLMVCLMALISVFLLLSATDKTGNKKLINQNNSNGSAIRNDTTSDRGKLVYNTYCITCHRDTTLSTLAPGLSILSSMTGRSIIAALESGKMRTQGASLSAHEKKAVAEWITGTKIRTDITVPAEAYTKFSLPERINSPYNQSGWGNNPEGTGFLPASQAGITEENLGNLKFKWAFVLPEGTISRAKPAIVENWLIIGTQWGNVVALDKQTGKIGWDFTANAAIRGAITVSVSGSKVTAYFADFTSTAYAVDVRTGKLIWSTRAGVDPLSGVTGSVVLHKGILYVPISSIEVASAVRGDYPCCISSGGLTAITASTGKILWQHRVVTTATLTGKKKNGVALNGPSGAPVWCSPTIDSKRGLVYIGTGQNYSAPATKTSDAIQALDLKTGKIRWSFQATENDMYNVACPFFENCPDRKSPDFDFGMAPIVMKTSTGKDILVVGQKAGLVYGISPDDGKQIWKTRIGKGGKLGGIHWGMATDGKLVYAANSDNKIAVEPGDTSIKASPGIYALNPDDGKVVWESPTPCPDPKNCMGFNSAAPLAIPGIVFAGSTDGRMRAYKSSTGKILWEYDSNISYGEIYGFKAHGGSIDGPPPVAADGMLFFNSGYGMFGQAPGNVLLAFSVK